MLRIHSFGKSDLGLKRENNEDVFSIDSELGFSLVADGMGGAVAGELASRMFADAAYQIFSGNLDRSEKAILDLVQRAFVFANKKILDHVDENPHHRGMGCTADLVALSNERFVIGHLGDSRTYRFRNGQLKQLTKDHSLVQDQLDRGLITSAEARRHPHRNVILRAVGIESRLALDLIKVKALSQDQFLLCSDGLTDMIDDALISDVLSSDIVLAQKVEKLINMAKSAGGNDNITVVLSEIL